MALDLNGSKIWGKIVRLFFAFSLLALFKHTQDQRDRDPSELKQSLGGDRPKHLGDPVLVQGPSVQAREHTYYSFLGIAEIETGIKCCANR